MRAALRDCSARWGSLRRLRRVALRRLRAEVREAAPEDEAGGRIGRIEKGRDSRSGS